jgi:hypothetical protein
MAHATADDSAAVPRPIENERRHRRPRPLPRRNIRLTRHLRTAGMIACLCGRAVAFAVLLSWRPDEKEYAQMRPPSKRAIFVYNVGAGVLATTV